MDAGLVGSLFTLLFFVVFIAIIGWAYSTKNKAKFDAAAQLPFEEDTPASTGAPNLGESK
ncbi:MAG: cbb3-type cytochrome c oxidase subunit 3 [Betaproteobacteria bacterium]|nr:MAG: cbb3-type cytochrome c oxidase subunit 3 [Betaproteobacteria bacterium]